MSRGQAMTEYVLLVGVLILALFTPWMGGHSPFLLFVDNFNIYLKSFHAVITLPIP